MRKIKFWFTYNYRKLRIWYIRNTAMNTNSTRVKRPVNCNAEVSAAFRIWNHVIHSKNAILMYDPVTSESLVEYSIDNTPIYLFLESRRLRIINSITGYDVSLTESERLWCEQNFKRELHIRRLRFKTKALNKIVNTLERLERKVIDVN
jgi:hypothetical protein